MYKITASLSFYWHFLLDITLTHVFVIAFLSAGFPYIASFFMSTDAILKVTLSIIMSRFVARIHKSVRGLVSIIIRFLLIGVWFIAISELPIANLSLLIFIPFITFKLLMLFDSFLSADFVFSLRDKFNVDLTQTAAAQNILVRSSTAIAPAIAMILLSSLYANYIFVTLSAIVWLLSTVLLRSVFFSNSEKSTIHHEQSKSLTQLLTNPIMRWGFLFQITGNIAFAGVAFLLLANLKLNGHILLNEITVLYSVFLIIQFAVLLFGQRMIPVSKFSHIGVMIGICGLFVFSSGFYSSSVLRYFMCAGIGLTYSFVISAIQKLVTSRLQSEGFIEYVGWAQMTGRLTSFLSTSTLGLILSFGYSPNTLLIWCGIIGMIAPIILTFFGDVSRINSMREVYNQDS